MFNGGIFKLPDSVSSRYHTIRINAARYLSRHLPDLEHPAADPISHSMQDCKTATLNFANLFASLRYRSTSKPRDETICFASLLRFDTNIVFDSDSPALQMLKFIQSLQQAGLKVPERFIFTNEDKLPFQGYQWAPASFMELENVLRFVSVT